MQTDRPKATTLRELLVELRDGYNLFEPILIEIDAGSSAMPDVTVDRTVTSGKPFDWAQHYTREYAGHRFLVVAPQSGAGSGSEVEVTIGRSRSCDVRLDNDSVSKLHAKVIFDRHSGDYFIVDENSRNGSCINGEPLQPLVRAPIWSGAYVSFGDALFVFIDPPTLRKLSSLAS
ncbi:MAG: FHA domain-containing protein [Deltaproteobacteria bacterium]|nr:MAG: FHA domain-containing protein [Deltaproteobacteria bacterium]